MKYMRHALFLLMGPLVLLVLLAGGSAASSGSSQRVSLDSTGTQGDSTSYSPAISADGRYVAFDSAATNLVLGDTNGSGDVFVYDRETAVTERVTVDSNGTQADVGAEPDSGPPAISADGRYVAFNSPATNLVPGDTNASYDVFVRDRVAGTTERVSVNSAGQQGNDHTFDPSISADGRYVAFDSRATNLVPGDTDGTSDVFVRDRVAGTTERVSVNSAGQQGNSGSGTPSISADGRYVAFSSSATNLVPDDTNGAMDVFVHDRVTGLTERVSVDSSGNQANGILGSYRPAISADGRYVAFDSYATNLVAGDTNDQPDVFVHDRLTGLTERVSLDSAGQQFDVWSQQPAISADGRYIVFRSEAIGPPVMSAVFVHDQNTGLTERADVSSAGELSNEPPSKGVFPRTLGVSADGRYVAFDSSATNLVPDDTNGAMDVFVRDRTNATSVAAKIVGPSPETPLPGSTVTFSWTAGEGAAGWDLTGYHLEIATGACRLSYQRPDILQTATLHTLSYTVHNLPTDGSTICVVLYSHFSPVGCCPIEEGELSNYQTANIAPESAAFTVHVSFSDNNSESVLITPTCNAGSTSNSQNANRTAPAVFSVTGVPAGGTTCRASAFGSPAGYTETSTCDNIPVTPGSSPNCTITYTLNPTSPKRAVVFIAGIGSCGGGPSDGNTCKGQPLCGDTGVRASTGWMRDALLNSPQLASRISLSSSDIVYFSYSGNYCDGSHGENGADPKYSKVDTCSYGIDEFYFGKLKDLVQRVTDKSPGMQVSIIAHSQGGLIASYFVGRLRQDDPDFLRQRVASVITFDSFPEGFSAAETAAADTWFSASDEYYRDCAGQSFPLNPPNVIDWNRSFSAVPGIAQHAAEPFGTDNYQVAFYTLTADRFGGPTNNDPIPDPATNIHQERHNEKIPGSGHSSIWSGVYEGIFNQTPEDTSRREELVICSLLSGLNHKGPKTDPCNTAVDQIAPGQTRLASMNVQSGASRADFDVSWAGSTVQVTVITPTGQRVDASNLPSDASHSAGPTFESFVFLNPESGLWQLEMYGADVHPQGENVYIDTNFSLVDTHLDGLLGDANCDGRIDVLDVTTVLGDASGTPSSNGCIGNGDVDGDGHITAMDGLLILKYVAGLVSSFPAAGP